MQSGSVQVGDELVLQRGDVRIPLTVHGISTGGAYRPPDPLKLLKRVRLSEPAAEVVAPGDLLTGRQFNDESEVPPKAKHLPVDGFSFTMNAWKPKP